MSEVTGAFVGEYHEAKCQTTSPFFFVLGEKIQGLINMSRVVKVVNSQRFRRFMYLIFD